jgi:hypothetical protein
MVWEGTYANYNQLHLKAPYSESGLHLVNSREHIKILKKTIHGTGQGSCASPAIWLMICSFIMDILKQNANGMVMEGVEKEIVFAIIHWIKGFVDDTSIFTNLKYGDNNLEELLLKATEDAQMWEGLLSATGGELEQELMMTNSKESRILEKNISESRKTLGTYKCVVGKESEQYEVLFAKSENIT